MSVWREQQLQKGSVCKVHIHCKQCKNDNICMDSLIAHMHRTLIKAIGCMTGVKEFYAEKYQLQSMTSKRSHLVKRLMLLLVIQFKAKSHINQSSAKNVTHLMVE